MDFSAYGFVNKNMIDLADLHEEFEAKVNKSVDIIRVEDLREKLQWKNNTPIKRFIKNIKEDWAVIYEKP